MGTEKLGTLGTKLTSDHPAKIFDNAISMTLFEKLRDAARNKFTAVDIGGTDLWHHSAFNFQGELAEVLSATLKCDVKDLFAYFRLNTADKDTTQRVHRDDQTAEWARDHAALVYLQFSDIATGTAMWATDRPGPHPIVIPKEDLHRWHTTQVVFAKERRLVVYSTQQYHSRFPPAASGRDEKDGRIVLVIFFNKGDSHATPQG
jgi:hypothetical protein